MVRERVGRCTARLIAFALTSMLIHSNAQAWVCLRDSDGDCVSWITHAPSFYIDLNSFTTSFASDSHLTGVDWKAYIIHAARSWAEHAGSGVLLTYNGTSYASCVGPVDYFNTVEARTFAGLGYPDGTIGASPRVFNASANAIVDSDICINSDYLWSVQEDIPSNRLDMRHTLTHEFGHFFGADHAPQDSIMAEGSAPGDSGDDQLWGDDKDFIRYTYGHRAHAVYARVFDPPTTWGSPWQLYTYTNLPVGASEGRNASGAWWVVRAEANTSRTGVRFRRTSSPPTPTSSWTSTYYADEIEHAPALAATTWDKWWVTAWPVVDQFRACSGLRIGVSADLFQTAYFFTQPDICTSHEVGLTYDDEALRFVMAYTANGQGPAGHEPGRVFVRTSVYGWDWSDASEVAAGVYADSGVSVACTLAGLCGLSYVRGDTNQRYDRQRGFTINGLGKAVMSTYLSHSNWVYDAPQLFVTTFGSPDTTLLLLDFTSTSTGVNSHWYMADTDFPVGGSWSSLNRTSTLRSSVAFNAIRPSPSLYYLP